MSGIINANDASFEKAVLQSPIPVLVDFWAPWCGPCKMIAPILEELQSEYEGRVAIVKINVDENTENAAEYGVRGIPTLLMFKDGSLAGTHVGMASATELRSFIDKYL